MDINNRIDAYNLQNNCKRIVVDFMKPDNNNQGFELGVYVGVGSIIFPYVGLAMNKMLKEFARSQLNIENKNKKENKMRPLSRTYLIYSSIRLILSSLLCVPKNKALISFSFFFFLAVITHFLWFWEIIIFLFQLFI